MRFLVSKVVSCIVVQHQTDTLPVHLSEVSLPAYRPPIIIIVASEQLMIQRMR